jgi:hypothetical protein
MKFIGAVTFQFIENDKILLIDIGTHDEVY